MRRIFGSDREAKQCRASLREASRRGAGSESEFWVAAARIGRFDGHSTPLWQCRACRGLSGPVQLEVPVGGALLRLCRLARCVAARVEGLAAVDVDKAKLAS